MLAYATPPSAAVVLPRLDLSDLAHQPARISVWRRGQRVGVVVSGIGHDPAPRTRRKAGGRAGRGRLVA